MIKKFLVLFYASQCITLSQCYRLVNCATLRNSNDQYGNMVRKRHYVIARRRHSPIIMQAYSRLRRKYTVSQKSCVALFLSEIR